MARSGKGICDARCQLFYTDMMKRENAMRVKWFLQNEQKLLEDLNKGKSTDRTTTPVFQLKEQPKQEMPSIVPTKSLPPWRPPDADNSININIMKPVDPEIKAIIYTKGIQSFITADNYMHERLKTNPDDRFYYPDCASWIYGWRHKDYEPVSPSKFGRRRILQSQLYHPKVSSLQRDPDWYRDAQTGMSKSLTC